MKDIPAENLLSQLDPFAPVKPGTLNCRLNKVWGTVWGSADTHWSSKGQLVRNGIIPVLNLGFLRSFRHKIETSHIHLTEYEDPARRTTHNGTAQTHIYRSTIGVILGADRVLPLGSIREQSSPASPPGN